MLDRRESAIRLIREAGGDELCERLVHLERSLTEPRRPSVDVVSAPSGGPFDFDVVFLGGGLSLVFAVLAAKRGMRVAVFDRARIGETHREWNASRPELSALSKYGLLTEGEIDALVVASYREGICRWHGGGTYPVVGALDCSVSAERLMRLVRTRAEESAVRLFDHHEVLSYATNERGGAVKVIPREGAAFTVTTRSVVEARGAATRDRRADLVCPTVGGVLTGLEEGEGVDRIDPTVGEILVTTEDVEERRQHIWEAFPGRAGEVTVYLFYYAPTDAGPHSLLSLYARFFERLSRYKRGDAHLVRPTFGYIPGWSRLGPGPTTEPRTPRLLLVGDAAARHSPLTYCGFGATLRSMATVPDSLERALEGRARPETAVDDAPIHALTGALARMMAVPSTHRPGDLNQLLDAAFATLHRMGNEPYGALLRDEMSAASFAEFLAKTSLEVPRVYREVLRDIGTRNTLQWIFGLAKARYRELTSV